MAVDPNEVERVALWLYAAAAECNQLAEVRAVLRVMMDQAIAGEGERAKHGMYTERSAPELVSRLISQWDEVARTIVADEVITPPDSEIQAPVGAFKRPRYSSLIEEAITAKGPDYSEASARTFRSDSLAILESLVAEANEATVDAAIVRQGFRSSSSYLTTLRGLAAVALARRPSS